MGKRNNTIDRINSKAQPKLALENVIQIRKSSNQLVQQAITCHRYREHKKGWCQMSEVQGAY